MSHPSQPKDWSATQYLKFGNERTRPVHDLLSQVTPHMPNTPNPRIYDLGCGPANSTAALLSAFPNAKITGLDSSTDMLSKARSALPNLEFIQGDVSTFKPDPSEKIDLLFSNAVFHWLRSKSRIPVLSQLLQSLPQGAILALQVPDNYHEPSHVLMRDTARLQDVPWAASFADTAIGDVSDVSRPDLDPVEAPGVFYDALIPYAASVNVWRTTYMHVLKDAGAIAEWVKGTGLQPYLNRIEDDAAKTAFLKEYERRLKEAYPELADGNVLLGYPRLFIVAVRK